MMNCPPFPKVLIVEDDIIVGRSVEIILKNMGLASTLFLDGESALRALSRRPDYQLAFIDVGLPDINGIDLGAIIRAVYPHIPVLLTTACSASVSGCGDEWDVLLKPYPLPRFREAIDRALRAAPPAVSTDFKADPI